MVAAHIEPKPVDCTQQQRLPIRPDEPAIAVGLGVVRRRRAVWERERDGTGGNATAVCRKSRQNKLQQHGRR
jgi:hypothetical protein